MEYDKRSFISGKRSIVGPAKNGILLTLIPAVHDSKSTADASCNIIWGRRVAKRKLYDKTKVGHELSATFSVTSRCSKVAHLRNW